MRRIVTSCLFILLAVSLCASKNNIDTSLPSDSDALSSSAPLNTVIAITPVPTSPSVLGIPKSLPSESISETEPQVLPWQEAYVELLKDYSGQFLMIDIDKDSTPELLIISYKQYDDEPFFVAYTFRDGKVLPLENCADAWIAELILYARTRTTTAPGKAPGLITYTIGPSAGMYGCSIQYKKIVIDGNKLVIDAHGEKYIDVEKLIDLFGGYGYDIDDEILDAALLEHTHYYINDSIVSEMELDRMFEFGEPITIYKINETNIRETIQEFQKTSATEEELTSTLLEQLTNPTTIGKSKYHRIYQNGYGGYFYMIFDKANNIVAQGLYGRCPNITNYNDELISPLTPA